jgi:hypothetical protein
LATVSDAGPAPMQAMRLPFFSPGAGSRSADVAAQIGGDALQAADGDGLVSVSFEQV